jgi:hypothetical protein
LLPYFSRKIELGTHDANSFLLTLRGSFYIQHTLFSSTRDQIFFAPIVT